MKRVAILVALVLILAGSGGWFFLRGASAEEHAAEAEEPAAEDPPGTLRIVELAPMVVPILREGRVIQHLTLLLQVELAGPVPEERILNLKPRLRNSLLKALHGVLAFKHVNEQEEILPIVRERLKKAGNDVFGPDRVNAVLVVGMSRRVPDEG